MLVGELRTHFKDILNRDDCTDTLADTFLSQGLTRLERVLRTNFQKYLIEITVGADDTYPGYFLIPIDYLAADFVKVNGYSYSRISPNRGEELCESGDKTRGRFYIEDGKINFRPTLSDGDILKFSFYRELAEVEAEDGYSEVTAIIPDLVMYSALVFAGVFFLDERLETFRQMYGDLLSEVQLQSDLDDLSGGVVISNPYEGYA
jgi:hypothetical protein